MTDTTTTDDTGDARPPRLPKRNCVTCGRWILAGTFCERCFHGGSERDRLRAMARDGRGLLER